MACELTRYRVHSQISLREVPLKGLYSALHTTRYKSADSIITKVNFGFGKFLSILSHLIDKIRVFYIHKVCKYAQIILEPRKTSLVARKENKRVLLLTLSSRGYSDTSLRSGESPFASF